MPRPYRFVRYLLPLLCLLLLLGAPAPATAAPVNADDELAVTRQAYNYLQKDLYKEPDNTAMLTAAYDEAQKALNTTDPPLMLSGNANAEWNTFAKGIRTLIDESKADLPIGALRRRMISAMATTVMDGHTYFLTKEQYDREQALLQRGDTSQTRFGFGRILIGNDVYIRTIEPGSNMEQAGARPGDQIVSIDGTPVTGDNAASLFSGPKEGDMHTIVVRHIHDTDPTTLMVTIRKYNVSYLTSRVIDGHIGYIAISQFIKETPTKLDSALADLHRQNVDVLMVDMRDDPGGRADAAESVIGRFVADGTVLGTSKGRGSRTLNIVAHSDRHMTDTLPLVVLADDFSGSAAEYFTLAAQEFRNAPIVGVKTAGGLGTAITERLSDGSGLTITISEYTTAKGAKLNGIGVSPDVEVADTTNDDIANGRDPQLEAAIMQANMQLMHSP